jgi:hypothetical protein
LHLRPPASGCHAGAVSCSARHLFTFPKYSGLAV